MVAVRKTNVSRKIGPDILVTRALGTIERVAEAMWEDDVMRQTGKPPAIRWARERPDVHEMWIRRGTAALLAMLETKEP